MPQNLHEKIEFFKIVESSNSEDRITKIVEYAKQQAVTTKHFEKIHLPEKCTTLFNNGIFTRAGEHACRYNPKGALAPNGKRYTCSETKFSLSQPPQLLFNIFTGVETNDTDIEPYASPLSYFNVIKIAASIYFTVVDWLYGLTISNEANDSQFEKDNDRYTIKISEMSIGQETDIATFNERFARWEKQKEENEKLVVAGSSRGAATIVNGLCQPHMKAVYEQFITVIVLEACFFKVEDTLTRVPYDPGVISPVVNTFLNLFTKYRKDGPQPGHQLDHFPEGIPVVIVSSLIDYVVPYESCQRLAYELAQRKKNDVYFLTLKNSRHFNYPFDDAEDVANYEGLLNAVYRRYGCQYVPEIADRGQHLLAETCIGMADDVDIRYRATRP